MTAKRITILACVCGHLGPRRGSLRRILQGNVESSLGGGRAITRWRRLIAREKIGQVALEHLDRSLRFDADNLRARNLKVLVLRKLGEARLAESLLRIHPAT